MSAAESASDPSAPSAQRPAKRRLRGRRRALTIASLALALLGGALGQAGTAAASPPPGYCTQTCNQAPAGLSNADRNAALEAANALTVVAHEAAQLPADEPQQTLTILPSLLHQSIGEDSARPGLLLLLDATPDRPPQPPQATNDVYTRMRTLSS
ncbi:hypothetical protein AB0945_16915 [Streptomyces sp. NPDC005474]|uniref:hypothetical protein n=1 Tax=Streptomyces sp. NPDC005474 TaxID=3154878 RepID=UPI0034517B19